jgi:hypothetical protein
MSQRFEVSIGGVKAFACFLVSCAIAGMAFSRAAAVADVVLIGALWTTMMVFLVRKVLLLWKHRHDPEARNAHISSGQGGLFPKRDISRKPAK